MSGKPLEAVEGGRHPVTGPKMKGRSLRGGYQGGPHPVGGRAGGRVSRSENSREAGIRSK